MTDAELEAVEAERFRAMLEGDWDRLERLLADELSYTHVTGRTQDKPAYLAALRGGSFRYTAFERRALTVKRHGDVAILTGEAVGTVVSLGREFRVPLAYASVYVKRDGRWQLTTWQATRLENAPPSS